MAYADTQTTTVSAPSLLSTLARPFVAIGNFLIRVAESSEMAKAVNQLSEMTDAELAAKGTSREAQVRHIFRGHLYL